MTDNWPRNVLDGMKYIGNTRRFLEDAGLEVDLVGGAPDSSPIVAATGLCASFRPRLDSSNESSFCGETRLELESLLWM